MMSSEADADESGPRCRSRSGSGSDKGMNKDGPGGPVPVHNSNEDTNTCFHCNGFYGVSFDVLCTTCHDFLYSDHHFLHPENVPVGEDGSWESGRLRSLQSEAQKDDGEDSGNDEPSEDGPVVLLQCPEHIVGISTPPASASLKTDADTKPGSEESQDPLNPQREQFVGVGDGEWNESLPGSSRQPTLFQGRESAENRLKLLSTPLKLQPYEISPVKDLTDLLPPEIWGIIFDKLDPFSLSMTSKAKFSWRKIIMGLHSNDVWKERLTEMWPIFKPIYEVKNWFRAYESLLNSVACKLCWVKISEQMRLVNQNKVRIPFRNAGLRNSRLTREIKCIRIKSDPPQNIDAIPLDNQNYNWLARISGPAKSPYQGGVFYLNIKIHEDYPLMPPGQLFHNPTN